MKTALNVLCLAHFVPSCVTRAQTSYQTSSKRSLPLWLLIGARKTQIFWHQSEVRTAATAWNWSGKTLSPGALLAVLYFSFVPYFSACLDFPSPPLSAPGSPRMPSPMSVEVKPVSNFLIYLAQNCIKRSLTHQMAFEIAFPVHFHT